MSLLLLLAVAAHAGPNIDQPWSDTRLSKLEVKANKELAAIERRIENGELAKVEFDLGSAKLRPESETTLDIIADLMLRYPELKLRIRAHTCTIGSKEYNLRLSDRRASSVKTYLAKQGVSPSSIRSKGMGFAEPIADNSTEEGRAKNRRVEFRFIQSGWGSVYQ